MKGRKRILALLLAGTMAGSSLSPAAVMAASEEIGQVGTVEEAGGEEVSQSPFSESGEEESLTEDIQEEPVGEETAGEEIGPQIPEGESPLEIPREGAEVDLNGAPMEIAAGELLADFNFDSEESAGVIGGGNAKATGTYSLVEAEEGKVLSLNGSGDFLTVTDINGASLLSGREEITISYDAKPNASGANWVLYASPAGHTPSYGKEKYVGVLAQNEKTTVERYNNNGGRPASVQVNSGSDWSHVDIVMKETETVVFLNGELKGRADSAYPLSGIMGNDSIFQIGRANWGSGEYYNGLLDNFQIYEGTSHYMVDYIAKTWTLGDLSQVKTNLDLPVALEEGVSVDWATSDEGVITAKGVVTRSQESDKTATLTATLSLGEATVEKTFEVTVLQADATQDVEDAKEALQMLTVTGEDLKLPVEGKLGTDITWKSSNKDIMTDDGKIVKRNEAGGGNIEVTMTATIAKGGKTAIKDFKIQIMEEFYGFIMGYITGDNDRTGSLHIGHSMDGVNFTGLNGNSGIQFAQIDTNDGTKNLSTGIRYNGVYLFRKADGTFGLVAPQGKNGKSVYLYDSKDLLTYSNERLLQTNTAVGNVEGVECGYDTLIGEYRINWRSQEEKYSNISSDLNTLKAAKKYEYTPAENGAQEIPPGAKNYNVIPVTKGEYEKIMARFAVVENIGVSKPDNITVENAEAVEGALPKHVTASYSDASESSLGVTWDTDSVDYSKAGTYTINGTVSTYSNPLIEQRADPQIIYDESGKCYYFTASYPAKNTVDSGYDRIVLRKADSIEGLADDQGGLDKEITIWTAPSSGIRAKHVWAPELQQINGKWYVFFAAGSSSNIWAIRPYVLVCQGEDPYNADNWKDAQGEPVIYAATSQESKYFKNMSLDMTYFEQNGSHYVIWADIIGQSALYMQKVNPDRPWEGISEVILLTTPEFGWERDAERVNEGATIIKHNGKIFCAFSASGTGPEYCIGMLYADESADLMDPKSWTKMNYPLLTSSDVPGEYGPGHNSFTVDAGGNPVFVYHARSQECYEDKCQWASSNPLYDPCRHARVKNVHWNEEGLPILKMSGDQECPEAVSATSIQVTVENNSFIDLKDAKITVPDEVTATGGALKPEIIVSYKGTELEVDRDYTVTYGENTDPGEGSVTINAVPDTVYTGSKTVTFSIVKKAVQVVHYDMSHSGNVLKNQVSDSLPAAMQKLDESSFHTYKGVSTLSLNKDGYVELPGGMVDDNTLTISVTAATGLSNNQWLWAFGKDNWNYTFLTPSNGSKATKYTIAQQAPNGNTGAYEQENTIATASAATDGRYQTYTVVINGSKTQLYVNGVKKGEGSNPFDLTTLIPAEGVIGYIGKSLYNGDPLFVGQVADFAVYDDALSTKQIKTISDSVNYKGYITADIYGKMLRDNSSVDEVTGDIAMPAKVDGVNVTWKVQANQTVIDETGKVTRPTDGKDAKIIVTASFNWNDEEVSEEFTLKVKALTSTDFEKMADTLAIPFSTQEKNEVYGNITLPKQAGKAAVAWATSHPQIVDVKEYAHEGAYEGDPTPAGQVTRPEKDTNVTMTATVSLGSFSTKRTFVFTVKAKPQEVKEEDYTDYFFAYFTGEGFSDGEQIYFSASRDGLNWSDLNKNQPYLTSTLGDKGVRDPFILRSPEGDKFYMIATDLRIANGAGWGAAQNAGSQALMVWESTDLVNWSKQRMVTVSAKIDAGCTWAPEITYDDVTGEYVVYWASKVAADNYAKQRLYYAKTRDFHTFTDPQVFIEKNHSTIDTTILKEGDSYYRYSKNESTAHIFAEKTSTLLHAEPLSISSPVLESQGGVEGPSIFKFNQDDVAVNGYQYGLLLDNYGQGGYYPMVSNDLNGDFVRYSGSYKLPGGNRPPRHGTPIRVTAAEYQQVMAAMAGEAELTGITLDGSALEGFFSSIKEYTVPVTGETYPVVEAAASAGARVTVTQATAQNPTATVTVEAADLANGTYTIKFVREVTGLKLENVPASIGEGSSFSPEVTAETADGNRNVTKASYTSSQSSVLEVSGNRVKGRKAGNATLYGQVDEELYLSLRTIEAYNKPTTLYDEAKPADFAGTTAAQDGSIEVPSGQLSFYDIEGDGSGWRDYRVSGSFKVTKNAAGIIFGASNAKNFYMWQFKENSLNMHKWVDGSAKVVGTESISLNSGYNSFKIYKQGNVIYTYLNDVLISSFADTAPYKAGTIGLRTGSSEEFWIKDLKAEKTNLVLSKAVTVTEKPITVEKVNGVALTATVSAVKVSWKKVPGATGYEVYGYNSTTKKYSRIATTSDTAYTHKGRRSATGYRYAVRAYTKAGKTYYGAYSGGFNVLTKPAAVTGVKAKRTSKVSTRATGTISFRTADRASTYRIYKYNKTKKKYEMAYRVQNSKLYKYDAKKKKYSRVNSVKVKNGIITCTLENLNLKKEKSQQYMVKSTVSKSGYGTQYSNNSKSVTIK